MALVKTDHFVCVNHPGWSERDKRATRHKIGQVSQSREIDYKNLQQICLIQGLGDMQDEIVSQEAHKAFMKNYPRIFLEDRKFTQKPSVEATSRLHKGFASSSSTRKMYQRPTCLSHGSKSVGATTNSSESHDIRDHLGQLHRRRVKVDLDADGVKPGVATASNIALLRKLLRKLPFQRTRDENESIHSLLKMFATLTNQVEPQVLKELCSVAMLDVWDEPGVTVYGNRGFFVILAGRVKASEPFLKLLNTDVKFRSPTPDLDENSPVLNVGDCFGTFEHIDGKDETSRVLSVMTLEAPCEFLLISVSDFARIYKAIHLKEENQKLNLLQSCKPYQHWSRQSLLIIANLMKWVKLAANTVVVSEGSKSPFVGIIRSGECKVTRKVNALITLRNLKQERKTKEVLIGKLGPFDSFAETNVLLDVPMSCTIQTSTPVELAVLYQQDVAGLDGVTRQLIKQSCGRVFSHVSEDDVHSEYVDQELKRQWKVFKTGVLHDTIESVGIHPGYGKWSK